MSILFLLAATSLLIFVAYLVYAIRVIKAVPQSLSDTYYQLKKHGRPQWLFQIAMITMAFTLIPAWIELSPTNHQFMAFLSCGGLMFVGAAPAFKLELEGKVHYWSAGICGVSALSWTYFMDYWWVALPLSLIVVISLFCTRFKNTMFWLEMVCFASAYISILIELCK